VIDNRALIAAMRRRQRVEPNESLFLAFLCFAAALVLLLHLLGVL